MPLRQSIPRPTVKRLSLYLRELDRVAAGDRTTISSKQLAGALGLTDAQVRKDLGCFGQFGRPGIGYSISELIEELKKTLGTDRQWNAAVVGAGNLGQAVMAYPRFRSKGFDIVAVFDNDSEKAGKEIEGHHVHPMADLPKLVQERDIRIGIISVPATAAQKVANDLIESGVRGILNFAPIRLDVHDAVSVASVDFSISLEQLAFQVSLGLTGSLEEAG